MKQSREVLFRGKGMDGWVEGVPFNGIMVCDLSIVWADEEVLASEVAELDYEIVKEETIGEYSGLDDKNGTKIFEGDIVQSYNEKSEPFYGVICVGKYTAIYLETSCNMGFYVDWIAENCEPFLRRDLGYWVEQDDFRVVGNIHDNPELLRPNRENEHPLWQDESE